MTPTAQPIVKDQPPAATVELLSFTVAGSDFCLPVIDICEVRSWSEPTPLPLSDPSLLGVINLRGTILPVIDLARKLALPARSATPGVIVVVASAGRRAGLAVDKVDDILTIPTSAISPAPALANSGIAAGLSGVIVVNNGCLPVLDVTLLMPFQSQEQA